MIKVSTMLYVTKDGQASDSITENFLQENNIRTVLTELVENDQKQMKFGEFLVDLLIYEVEEQFIKFLFYQRTVPGLIYCGTIDHPDTMYIDIKSIADEPIRYVDAHTYDDITEEVEAHPETYNVVSLSHGDNCFIALVMEFLDEDITEDEYFMADNSVHICQVPVAQLDRAQPF